MLILLILAYLQINKTQNDKKCSITDQENLSFQYSNK